MKDLIFPIRTTYGHVRKARRSDVPMILRMVQKLAEHHEDNATLSEAHIVRDAFTKPAWVDLLIADVDGTPVGYAALRGLIQLQYGMRGYDLHHLFIEPEFRGQGIGSSLITACRILAKQRMCGYLTVSTHPKNMAAQTFYEGQGFLRRQDTVPRFTMSLGDP